MSTVATPLCVDVDGTLIRSDLLWEGLFIALKERPLALLRALLAWPRGRAAFKLQLASEVTPDIESLPLNEMLVERLRQEKSAGRRLVMATASPRPWAELLAQRLELFDEVIATDGQTNLAGSGKAAALVSRYGERGFDYAGNSAADLPVWRAAQGAWIVAATAGVARRARALGNTVEEIAAGAPRPVKLWKAMRPHQWLKNLLLFVPLMAAHAWQEPGLLVNVLLAYAAFCLTASATYLLNDLLDLSADRRHPRKRARPFASGNATLASGALLLPLMLLAAALIALWLPVAFGLALAVYVVVTLAYSFGLKRKPVVDAMTLAGLYTLRLLAGSAVTGIEPSSWLLAFSMFVFLSLAFAKRYAELLVMLQAAKERAAGRGYEVNDLPIVLSLGVGSGLMSVLVLALYFDSSTARELYRMPPALWILCPLLLWWISRVWFKTHRGQMHDDPVVFAIRDRPSHVAIVIGVAAIWLAS